MKKRALPIYLLIVFLLIQIPIISLADDTTKIDNDTLKGKYISVMGDSISTYMGWSDARPITSEEYANRYGEPYYGPVGSDCHNTELLVEDTWWHQTAEALGAKILVSNAGNSTGLLHASYPANADWQQYLQDMLAYKTRPYYMGTSKADPDIIALYIGSSDVGKVPISQFGTVEEINFDNLIVANSDGTFTYAEPTTVAEAYCILLHKLTVTYPKAEIYCFTVVPNSGGYLSTCNKRLEAIYPFNDMVRSVANHYDAIVVDIFEAFNLDPDGDGIATQEDFTRFQSYYYGDPHPNAAGFDVISDCFTNAIVNNSKYIVPVETTGGRYESVGVKVTKDENIIKKEAKNYTTNSGMKVNYNSTDNFVSFNKTVFDETYNVVNKGRTYWAEGGTNQVTETVFPILEVNIPMTDKDYEKTEYDDTSNTVLGHEEGIIETTGDTRSSQYDGIYDYTEKWVKGQSAINVKTQLLTIKETINDSTFDDMKYISSDTLPTANNNMITNYPILNRPQSSEDVPTIPNGYDHIYIGSDQISNYWAAYAFDTPDMESYPAEEPIYADEKDSLYVRMDHNVFIKRKLTVPAIYFKDRTVTGAFPAWYESIQQFTLANRKGQIITTYCADQNTPALTGHAYRLVNLQDSTYYSNDDSKMIYTIANHGYWGTDSGFGSLSSVKQMMRDSGIFTEAEIASLTDGMAMTATQYAIWTYSNAMDEKTFINSYYTTKTPNYAPVPADQESAAVILKLSHYLASLTPEVSSNNTTQNTIINENNFLNEMSLKITGKPQNHINNLDEDTTNDVYNVDLSFDFKVKPSTENGDDLVLKIMEDNQVIAIGRVAGTLQEGETQLIVDENKRYVFNNLTLKEGTQNLDFILAGSQKLEMLPYLFTSEIKDGEPSQTMVGIAEGNRSVNVSMALGFSLDVKDETLSTKHTWRTEKTTPGQKYGSINGLKVDENQNPIEGVVFGLFKPNTKEFTEENAFKIATTNQNGEFSFNNIAYGNWIIKELSCPENYILSNETFKVTISQKTSTVALNIINQSNKQNEGGKVQVTKISSEDHNQKLSGAVFEVYVDANNNGEFDAGTDTLYGTLNETETGIYELEGLDKNGYFLYESKAPNGYIKDERYFHFLISENGDVAVIENKIGVGFINDVTQNPPPENPDTPKPETKPETKPDSDPMQGSDTGIFDKHNNKSPKTGDDFNIALWICILAVGVIGVPVVSLLLGKNHTK